MKVNKELPHNFLHVEKGKFMMGFEGQAHEVKLRSFAIGKYTVTFEEYDAYCEDNGLPIPKDEHWGRGRRPVVNVSWSEAIAYAQWLSQKEGQQYRLPTEAEWEYAALGGKESKGYAYAGSDQALEVAHCGQHFMFGSTAIVGQKKANELGIHDMSGNVLEWCSDYFDEDYYKVSPMDNPQGPAVGTSRVLRGGSYMGSAESCKVWLRYRSLPDNTGAMKGFRLLLEL